MSIVAKYTVEPQASLILEELGIPLFLVDKTAAVLYANAATAQITGQDGFFNTANQKLTIRNHADNAHLQLAISNASAKSERETIMIGDNSSPKPLLISVAPFHEEGGEDHENEALVMVQKCNATSENFMRSLRQLFRLSPSEIAIAAALVSGTDVEHIAELRGAKVTTVRTQVAAIMLKTRTRRQGELVALLSRISSLP